MFCLGGVGRIGTESLTSGAHKAPYELRVQTLLEEVLDT